MPTIGFTSIGGGREVRYSDKKYDINLRDSRTPSQPEIAKTAHVYCEGKTVESSIDVGLIRVDTGEVVIQTTITIPANDTPQWYTKAYSPEVTLSPGVEYAQIIGSGQDLSYGVFTHRAGSGTNTDNLVANESGQPITGPITELTKNDFLRSNYTTTELVAVPTVTISGDIKSGSVISGTYANFTNPPTKIRISDGSGHWIDNYTRTYGTNPQKTGEIIDFTASGGTWSCTLPSFYDLITKTGKALLLSVDAQTDDITVEITT